MSLTGKPTPLALLGLYAGFVLYDEHRVRSMCAKLNSGTTINDAKRFVVSAGLSDGFLKSSIYDERAKAWFFAIPVGTTMGDEACAVYHDGRVIIKAEMVGP